jgi:hypothetical protein
VHLDPFRLAVQLQPIAIEMVVRRDEIYIFLVKQKANHVTKLPRQIDIVVFCEIDDVAVFLRGKEIDLLCEGLLVSRAVKLNNDQFMGPEILSKQVHILIWASVEYDPQLDSKVPQRFLEGSKADFRQAKFIISKRKPARGVCNLGVNPIRDSYVIAIHLTGSMGKGETF